MAPGRRPVSLARALTALPLPLKPMYLIIDTSTKHAAAGLWRDGLLVRTAAWRSRRHHTVELMPAIERLLAEESASPDSLLGIAVATGPGGFSALRAGLSVAKGLAFALSLLLAAAGWAWLRRAESHAAVRRIKGAPKPELHHPGP